MINLGSILSAAAGLLGLSNSARESSAARRDSAMATSLQERELVNAEAQTQAASEYQRSLVEWINNASRDGAFSADAQVERGKQDIADYERRGLAGVNARGRAAGFREGDSLMMDEQDRVAISAREALADIRAQLEPQLRAQEFGMRAAAAPDPNLAGIYQSMGDQRYRAAMTSADRHRQAAGNPASILASILPFFSQSGRSNEGGAPVNVSRPPIGVFDVVAP